MRRGIAEHDMSKRKHQNSTKGERDGQSQCETMTHNSDIKTPVTVDSPSQCGGMVVGTEKEEGDSAVSRWTMLVFVSSLSIVTRLYRIEEPHHVW